MRLKIREVTEKVNFLNAKDWYYGFNFLGLKIIQVVKYITLYTNVLGKITKHVSLQAPFNQWIQVQIPPNTVITAEAVTEIYSVLISRFNNGTNGYDFFIDRYGQLCEYHSYGGTSNSNDWPSYPDQVTYIFAPGGVVWINNQLIDGVTTTINISYT